MCKEIGHARVSQTERYADFNIHELKDDFPSLAHKIDSRLKKSDHLKAIESLGQTCIGSFPISA